jgi:nucleoside-diphosphate-sugar epimerase
MDRIIAEDIENIINDIDLSVLKGKTILITGVSGMLGTYILFSIKEFNERYAADIKINAVINRALPQHLIEITNCSFIRIIQGDLTDIEFCNSLPKADVIFHAACYAQPSKFMQDIEKTIKLNTLTTSLLLEKINQKGSFLFFSSVAVYIGYDGIANESADIYRVKKDRDPRECYYRSKKAGEYICNTYSLIPDVTIKTVRIGLTYGPGTRSDDSKVLSDFINKAKSGKIEMRDQGVDLQHYCYITDMIKELLNVFLFGKERLYNIGCHSRISIREVAEMVGKIMNAELIIPTECGSGKQITVNVDDSLYMSEFPNIQFVDLYEGIKRTIDWKKLMRYTPSLI